MKSAPAKPRKSPRPQRGRHAMAFEPNLIITIDERRRGLAEVEIQSILARVSPNARLTGPPGQGLVGVYMPEDPRACIARLRATLAGDPFSFQHTHRWLPIEEWARAEAKEVAKFAQHALAEIAPDETWGIKAERHSTQLESGRLIQALARDIDNRNVNLREPDKVVLMEIVGQRAGLSVIEKDQTLSVEAEMKQFVEFEEIR